MYGVSRLSSTARAKIDLIRIVFGVGALIVLALFESVKFVVEWDHFRHWQNVAEPGRALRPGEKSLANAVDGRMSKLRPFLPERAVVGYLSDLKSDAYQEARWVITKYALSPAIVLYNTQPELIVGDFEGYLDPETVARERGYIVVKDMGNGAVLFKKVDR